jgi:hypothetical protein
LIGYDSPENWRGLKTAIKRAAREEPLGRYLTQLRAQ